ncbi:MAG: transposase [Gammaproteobacteria bacterium]|nr:transposase [Gammaproteobacteria bacterium]
MYAKERSTSYRRGYYHVIGRRYIFNDTEDKQDFLSRLGDNLKRSQSQCLAWAMMSNHYHLLIRVGM